MPSTVLIARARVPSMIAAVCIAWLGMVVHNLADLPISFMAAENTIPGLIWLVLLVLWIVRPSARLSSALLLAWGTLNLLGAVVTVLPLPFLPFEPEQTVQHYVFHMLYAATQVPLLLRTKTELARIGGRQGAAQQKSDVIES